MLKANNKTQKDILPCVTQYQPSVPNLKEALLTKCHLIRNQPQPRQIVQRTTAHFVQKRKILKRSENLLVRAKL